MKRGAFVAVTGLAAATASVATISQLQETAQGRGRFKEHCEVVEWQALPNIATLIRRYYVFDVFPEDYRPHITTARLVNYSFWHRLSDRARAALTARYDRDTEEEVRRYLLHGEPGTANLYQFRDGDVLPCVFV